MSWWAKRFEPRIRIPVLLKGSEFPLFFQEVSSSTFGVFGEFMILNSKFPPVKFWSVVTYSLPDIGCMYIWNFPTVHSVLFRFPLIVYAKMVYYPILKHLLFFHIFAQPYGNIVQTVFCASL